MQQTALRSAADAKRYVQRKEKLNGTSKHQRASKLKINFLFGGQDKQ
jgi:hypothetical protein